MNRFHQTTLALCAVMTFLAGTAGATIKTFEFSGTVGTVYDKTGLLGGIEKGTEFKGSYWVDTEKLKTIQDSLKRNNSYVYRLFEGDDDAFGMDVTIGEVTFTSGSKRNTQITSYSNQKQESFSVCAYADTESSNSTEYVALSFTGRDNALDLQSDPLLLNGANLDDKNVSAGLTYLDYDSESNSKGKSTMTYAYALGDLGSFTGVGGGGGTTPEPGTLAILIFGGGVLFFRHKRNKQSVP